ncbi:GNAT family N-acetyltransferase [Pelagicoccus sp. SDUM812005]|uniref:GNAT family N-acetyltransferase n=1 Tax=Pelagicoccus sp. SDUM812005 TaxID=3041257 RepID=UPI00280EE32D|nr:GNAT family N-acetyltransferase [Pelagicoccus sp. SDUM812005]MDQ8181389.1 GNAT family N-acetyltransferase [Pelagicoccus sp. SDUM812005]
MAKLYLRRPERRDGKEFVAAVKASESLHRPWVFPTQDLRGYYEYLERIQDVRQEGYFVCRVSDDRIVGLVNLGEVVRGAFQSAYVGYWAVAEFVGKGLMKEGLARVVERAFSEHGLHRLEANIQPGNEPSRQLVRRLGFRLEGFSPKYLNVGGEWRDHERWALTAEEWPGVEAVLGQSGTRAD